jgi:hypothetical protein
MFCFAATVLDRKRADAVAATLDIDVHETGICLPCLSFVSFPLDRGEQSKVRGAEREFTPILWDEGLAEPARAALERACERGVRNADRALADVDRAGAKTPIARAIVCVLALQLVAEMRAPWN